MGKGKGAIETIERSGNTKKERLSFAHLRKSPLLSAEKAALGA